MVMIILAAYIALLSFGVKQFAGNKRHRWIHAGYFTAFLLPILVHFLFSNIVGKITGAGIGASAVGLLLGIATFVAGFIYLYIGYTSKSIEDS